MPNVKDMHLLATRSQAAARPFVAIGGALILASCNAASISLSTDAGRDASTDGGDAGAEPCAEPPSCPGVDRTKAPNISCHTPTEVVSGQAATLHLFGTYLQDTAGQATKVAFSGPAVVGGNVVDSVPVSACHLEIQIPSGMLSGSGAVEVRAITGTPSNVVSIDVR